MSRESSVNRGSSLLDQPRSWLFVPGAHGARFEKAVSSGADAVILDLEDSVGPSSKVRARATVRSWLNGGGSAWVRINASGTSWHEDDLRALAGAPGLLGVVLPKAESSSDVAKVGRLAGDLPVVALVETAVGIHRAVDIAEVDCPVRLAFGSIDFARDIGASHEDRSLLFARSALVVASRIGGRAGPIDGVTSALGDVDLVGEDAARAQALGFSGKLCIHPEQVTPVHEGFSPTRTDLVWAQGVLDAARSTHDGVTKTVAGEMVDRPVIERALSIMSREGRKSDHD